MRSSLSCTIYNSEHFFKHFVIVYFFPAIQAEVVGRETDGDMVKFFGECAISVQERS